MIEINFRIFLISTPIYKRKRIFPIINFLSYNCNLREKMKYEYAEDLQMRMNEIVELLKMEHIDVERVKCFRGYGSSTRRTLARCHTIGKLMQKTIGVKAHYAIEFLDKFEKMPRKEQDKVIIHELLHIPKTFGGGFRQHDFVCEENVEIMYEKYVSLKNPEAKNERFGLKTRWW